MTHRLNRWLLVLVLLIAGPFWYLLIDNKPGATPAKPIHIAELRQLAGAIPGPRPVALRYTVVATQLSLGDVYAAGIGLKRRPLALISWSLPVPGAAPIVIDPDRTRADALSASYKNFDPAKQAALAAEAAQAGVVLATHQPPGGAGAASSRKHGPPPGIGMAPAAPQAVAPGVVVIPAPDYAPGEQLIFVQAGDGREFLFAGDISMLEENWTQWRARSLLAGHWLAPENRASAYAWLATIRQLHAEAPKLLVIPGNDYAWLMTRRLARTISEADPAHPSPPLPSQRRK